MPPTDVPPSKQFLHVTPILITQDIAQTVHYYETTLGFEKVFDYGDPIFYAGVSRDGFDFHFSRSGQHPVMQTRDFMGADVYVTVADMDRLYSELVGRGAKVVYGPAKHDYGMKEFHVEDCNGYRLAFGQRI